MGLYVYTPVGLGQVGDPDSLNNVGYQVQRVSAPGWIDYSSSFVLSATTTNPTKGNSTYMAHYRYPAGGDIVTVRIYILIGSTFAAGSGLYRFSLPVPASANSILGSVGMVFCSDTGTAGRMGVAKFVASNPTQLEIFPDNNGSPFSNTIPQVWAAGDWISLQMDYEPVS